MKKILFILIIFSLFLTSSTTVYGQVLSQSITVYPAVVDLESSAGESTRFLLQFRNNGKIPVAGTIKIADFTIKDKEGTPVLLENEVEKPVYAASSWISANTYQIAIPANDFTAVYFSAKVPNNVKTCGNYALIYFENEASTPIGSAKTTSSASSITTKIGALINFTMKNKICQDNAFVSNLQVPVFSEYGPVKTTFEIINKGDYHIIPTGTVYVANILNGRTDEQVIPEKRIFPGVLKEYELTLGKKLMIGRYQLVINGRYGINNLPVTASAYFWVFPWRLAIIILLAVILLVLLGKKYFERTMIKEKHLEEEVAEEKEEIEKLKEQLKKNKE